MSDRKFFIGSKFISAFLLCVLFFAGSPYHAYASNASLYLGPSTGTFTLGSTFTVSIYVNTGGQAVNAIEADLKFPPEKLQIVSPTVGKSLVQIWISQPSYSNTEGTLHFQGTVPHPGIVADAGLISTVTFRVMQTGTARIEFRDTSRVLLDDGNGTDVLAQTTNGIYSLILPPPTGPIVTSPNEPDQDAWYARKNITFIWDPPEGSEGYSYIVNQEPLDNPDTISEGSRTSVGYANLPDGVYYFHIKSLRNGVWGGITHYKVQLDNTPPAVFTPKIEPSADTSDQTPVIYFETTDAASGVDHYALKLIPLNPSVAEAQTTPFFFETSSPYSRRLDYGGYDVVIRAYDKAGNYYQSTSRLTIALPVFEIVRNQGVRFANGYVLTWPYVFGIALTLLLILGYSGRKAWIWHRKVEEYLRNGAQVHPTVSGKVQLLRDKQSEYQNGGDKGNGSSGGTLHAIAWLLIFGATVLLLFGTGHPAYAAALPGSALNPPLITLSPSAVSNDQIPYVGGTVDAPGATVMIFVENADTGSTLSYTTIADKDGQWFFSLPQFLDPGHYRAWAELKVGETMSPPSARADFSVSPNLIQVGGMHVSYEMFYLIVVIMLLITIVILLTFTLYHYFRARAKHHRFVDEVRIVEESLRRGFLLIQHDIEGELALVKKMRASHEISDAEKEREKKLLHDLTQIRQHVGEEVWELGEKEKEGE